jgi:glycosyltransferase
LKISIITACYNSASTIEGTIKSVLSQDHPDVEYIIVDGLSKDDTMKVVDRYRDRIAKIISEKDKGIYDAINKGIAAASGEVIGLLHSDDVYANEKVLSGVAGLFEDKKSDSVYADLQYVSKEDVSKVIRYWRSGEYREGIFKKGWMPPHPTFFLKRSCYERFGVYNLEMKTAADYELMLRMLHRYKVSTAYLPEVIVKMRVGGKSNSTLRSRIIANRDDKRAWKLNGLKPGLFTFILKPLSKIGQYFRK